MKMSSHLKVVRTKLATPSVLVLYSFLVYLFLFLPISMIVLFSFNTTPGGLFPMKGFTLQWYAQAFTDQIVIAAAQRSLLVATITALVSGVFGTLCAIGLARYDFPLKRLFWILILMPMLIPALMLGISLLNFFHMLGIKLSLLTVIIGHCVWGIPYVIFIVYARMKDFDWAVEEAAHDLGANTWQTFSRVTFPMIATSVISAMMIIFAWSFDDFLVTFFTIGNQATLPIIIWGLLRKPVTPLLNTVGTLLFTFSVLLLVSARLIGKFDIEF